MEEITSTVELGQWKVTELLIRVIYSQLPIYRSQRDPYYPFDITEFRYKWSDINGLEVLGERTHFEIAGIWLYPRSI